jgi:hypothetical protein
MIKEFEFFHGVVFARILHSSEGSYSIRLFKSACNSAYVLNESAGMYIKYSSKRMTPWRFTFTKVHQQEIEALRSDFENIFLLLVCNDDGVVCLNYSELKQILDNQHDPIEWISATRHKREMYTVKGSNGELDFKIGQNDFPEKVFATLRT